MQEKITELEQVVNKYNKNDFSNLTEFVDNELVQDFFKILELNKIIRINNRGRIKKNVQSKIIVGPLSTKDKKFGFILGETDYYVYSTKGYLNNDMVIAIEDTSRRGSSSEAKIIDVLLREPSLILTRINARKKIILLGENPHNYRILLADKQQQNLFNERQIVQFKIVDLIDNTYIVDFVQVVADENDPDKEMKIVLANHGIETEFSDETIKQIETINEISVAEITGRVDLRDELVMTIDGADSKDLDDAIHLIKEANGYRLTVSIADVSHYVVENTPLDLDAQSRATSVYFVDRVVPMLPKKLSNGICSLHPNVDRLTISCEMLIDNHGQVIESKIYPSIINSKYRLTYNTVNQMLIENDPEVIAEHAEIYGVLKTMNQLRKILNKKRLARGSFNLEDKDAKFTVNDEGKITDIKPFVRLDAERLIEEFMIVANETVAETIFWMELPFIYRIHDKPNPRKLKDVLLMFQVLGVHVKLPNGEFHPQVFKQALDQIEDPINKRIVSDLIVRSLSKAKYLEVNHEHFGLASKYYTHFTSPIRRYPDLIVHRKLREYLFDNQQSFNAEDVNKLKLQALHCSEKEVKASKAEYLIEDMKKAEYMKQFVNQQFVGVVASITDYGFFVELENTVRGLIRFNTIKEFNKAVNYKILFSENRMLTIGDKIEVKLTAIDYHRGLVEFEPVDFTTIKRRSNDNNQKQKDKSRLSRRKKNRGGNRTTRKRNKVNSQKRR